MAKQRKALAERNRFDFSGASDDDDFEMDILSTARKAPLSSTKAKHVTKAKKKSKRIKA